MYQKIVGGPGKWDIVMGANEPSEHGRKKIVVFTFMNPTQTITQKIRVEILFSGSRRNDSVDIFLRAVERLGESDHPFGPADGIYHYLYSPDSRKGDLVDVDFAKFAQKRTEGREL